MTKIAICLSGGGSLGNFEVGVVEFLYEHAGIRPDILTGTSVGAINAAKLAEGEDPTNLDRGWPGLKRIWASLQADSDMWSEEAWWTDPDMNPQ